MRPNLKATIRKMNKERERIILIVKAFTVLWELSLSRTKKNNPLASAPAMIIITKMMKSLVIICYTPNLTTLRYIGSYSRNRLKPTAGLNSNHLIS